MAQKKAHNWKRMHRKSSKKYGERHGYPSKSSPRQREWSKRTRERFPVANVYDEQTRVNCWDVRRTWRNDPVLGKMLYSRSIEQTLREMGI